MWQFACVGFGAVLLAASASRVMAQEPGRARPLSAVQVDNAQSTSKPDETEMPEANPARPTVTNPAHIPPVGYLQFE